METDNSSNINDKKSGQEEQMILSSLSINQKSLQERGKRKLNDEIMKQQEKEKKEKEETHRLSYDNLSDDEIKERLLKTIIYDTHLRIQVHQWLETDRTLLLFIRQYTSLLVKYSSLKLELELYQSYAKMTESLLPWLSTMSKALLEHNYINHQFFQIQNDINKHLKNTEKEFGMITQELAKSISDQQQLSLSSSSSTVDIKLITSSILIFVRGDLQRLNVELIKKRHLLTLNPKDICLLHEFYYLQPDDEQLQIAENIWRITIAKQRAQRIGLNNQPNKHQNVDYAHQIEVQKQMFLALNKKIEKGNNILPINYLRLNKDLLMNIIESRQKLLIQHLEFEHDFNNIFPLINNDDDNKDDQDNDDIYQENELGFDKKKRRRRTVLTKLSI